MKLRILSLYMSFFTFFYAHTEASHPVFGFASAPSQNPIVVPTSDSQEENPFGSHDQIKEPVTDARHISSTVPAHTEKMANTTLHPHPENPFASPVEQLHHDAPHTQLEHSKEQNSAVENPFQAAASPSSEQTHESIVSSPSEKATDPVQQATESQSTSVEKSTHFNSHSQEHRSTAAHAASIPTLVIVPGHSAMLAPLTGREGSMHYVIQDKKYDSYLVTSTNHEKTAYTVTIPKTVHSGSFTVFKVEGDGVHPHSLQPAYHVAISGFEIEGTQFSEEQISSAQEKLKTLENQYLANMQEHFKAFMKDLRDVIEQAHTTGENLFAPKPPVLEKITTHQPVTLTLGQTHILTTFAGGSAQSANPALVAANLTFKGTPEKPEWQISLTAHKVGETVITYSTGSETFEQPVFVKSEGEVSTDHASDKEMLKEEGEPPIPLKQEGALASFLRADEDLPGEAAAEHEEKDTTEHASREAVTKEVHEETEPAREESDASLASNLEEQTDKEEDSQAERSSEASSNHDEEEK